MLVYIYAAEFCYYAHCICIFLYTLHVDITMGMDYVYVLVIYNIVETVMIAIITTSPVFDHNSQSDIIKYFNTLCIACMLNDKM